MLYFFKKPFGCVVFFLIIGIVSNLLMTALHMSQLGLRIGECILPVLNSFVYTLWIYQEKIPSKFALKVALYKYLIAFIAILGVVLISKIVMKPEMLHFLLDAQTIENLKNLFQDYDTNIVMLFAYLSLGFVWLVLAPIYMSLSYFSIKIGNYLGLSLLNEIDDSRIK